MPSKKPTPKYERILLKLSGEALGKNGVGIDPKVLDRTALEIGQLVGIGIQVGIVIGGGNLFRGAELSAAGLDRVTGDHMGMLATVMNALAMRDALERANIQTVVMSAIPMSGVVEHYDRRLAIRHLEEGDVVIFSSGTGNPFFTTDSAACLRGIEVDADGAERTVGQGGARLRAGVVAEAAAEPGVELRAGLGGNQGRGNTTEVGAERGGLLVGRRKLHGVVAVAEDGVNGLEVAAVAQLQDRKSTRLNSSH